MGHLILLPGPRARYISSRQTFCAHLHQTYETRKGTDLEKDDKYLLITM